ncbi:MAG: DnaJ domain-containing protein [Chitinivibrionales bacterium]|nr:DnaJ domain-containing protein [Chitinivibrionales bacterium]MBD3396436.1 DnaJ domain-containing protein [Chitinivibrionales bacterium]
MSIPNQKLSLYKHVQDARETLGLGEEATMDEIKAAFRNLIRQWHPDKTRNNDEQCRKRTGEILQAYATVMDYCREYRISFSRETVSQYCSQEELWKERFGNDPMWSAGA